MSIDSLRALAGDLGVNLIAALLYTAFGYCLRLAQVLWKKRRISASVREFFGLTGDRLLIIHTAVLDVSRQAYNLPSCDTKAARAIARLLEGIGQLEGKDFDILPEGDFVARFGKLAAASDNDLVLLCGPKRNALVTELLSLTPYLRYQLSRSPETGENMLYDRDRNSQLLSSREAATASGVAPYDFGMILSMPCPLNTDRQLVILAGIHGTGTLAAAEFISEPERIRALRKRRQHGVIQELVRAEYKNDPELLSKTILV